VKLTQKVYHEAEALLLACNKKVPKKSWELATPIQRSTLLHNEDRSELSPAPGHAQLHGNFSLSWTHPGIPLLELSAVRLQKFETVAGLT